MARININETAKKNGEKVTKQNFPSIAIRQRETRDEQYKTFAR